MSAEERLEQLHGLLIEAATGILPEEVRPTMESLLREFPDVQRDDWELLAARAELELLGFAEDSQGAQPPGGGWHGEEALPEEIREAVLAALPESAPDPVSTLEATPPGTGAVQSRWTLRMALAAGILGIFFVWNRPDAPVEMPLTRESLLAQHSDAVEIPWQITEDPSAVGASGDVVWSAGAQTGFMRFVGFEPNDPTEWQYQLWIFDKTRPEATPVDGGVFDIPEDVGGVSVPIRAKLPVGEAHLFAVTVEKAGGVVVSDRSRIAVLASVPQAERPTGR